MDSLMIDLELYLRDFTGDAKSDEPVRELELSGREVALLWRLLRAAINDGR